MKLLFSFFALSLAAPAFAQSECVVRCQDPYSTCLHYGSGARPAAFHLNEMMNAADPGSARAWRGSCSRTIEAEGDQIVSRGDTCEGKSPPVPKDGISYEISGEIRATMEDGSLAFASDNTGDARFRFWAEGFAIQNERVISLSRSGSRLIVEAGNGCYSIH